jgi:hypothetical protein
VEPTDYLSGVRAALDSRGFEVSWAEVAGRPVEVGQRSDFRWRWFAVRLHTAVIVATFTDEQARRAALDEFLAAASRWAVQHRHGSRLLGLQSGTAAVTVVVLPDGAGEATAWASQSHGQRFAALAYPVAVDLRAGSVVQPKRMVVGGIFAGFLRGVVRDVVQVPPLPGSGVPR